MNARNPLEWLVLGISGLAVALVAGILLVDGLTGVDRPADPAVELRLEQGRAGSHGWLIPASVTNRGDHAAEDVVIEATATVGGEEETSELTVAFLPADSSVDVEFGLSGEPSGQVTVRVVGFRRP